MIKNKKIKIKIDNIENVNNDDPKVMPINSTAKSKAKGKIYIKLILSKDSHIIKKYMIA